ncbi:hypothetical protein B0H13DRAFT_1893439 [Mycena leptocephala]|nr:hypothetical protein B0H13DRAFT_1893439 [Mycena leptocephala]
MRRATSATYGGRSIDVKEELVGDGIMLRVGAVGGHFDAFSTRWWPFGVRGGGGRRKRGGARLKKDTFKPLHSRLTELGQILNKYEDHIDSGHETDLTAVISYLDSLRGASICDEIIRGDATLKAYLDDPQRMSALPLVPKLSEIIDKICTIIPHQIIFDYLSEAAQLNFLPYRWRETLDLMPPLSYHFSHIQQSLERSLYKVVSIQLEKNNSKEPEWVDSILERLYSFWCPEDPTVSMPPVLILYLNNHLSDHAVAQTVLNVKAYLDGLPTNATRRTTDMA